MIDNYDSFTYNIVQYLSELGARVHTVRNDAITLEELIALRPARLVISPGPGSPDSAGISCAAIRHFAGLIPILGVCLGHQAIVSVFGGRVIRHSHIMHGKTSPMDHDGKGLFANCKPRFAATRYHSLVGETVNLPHCLVVTCRCDEQEEANNLTPEQLQALKQQSASDSESSPNGQPIGGSLESQRCGRPLTDDSSLLHPQSASPINSSSTLMGVRHADYTIEGVQFHPESISTECGHEMLRNFLQFTGGKWTDKNAAAPKSSAQQ